MPAKKLPSLQSMNRRWHTIAIVALVVVIGITGAELAYDNKHSLAEAFALATTHKPEHYTELYFDNSIHLPTVVAAGKATTFAFHIANHEAKTVTYHYQIVLRTQDAITMLQEGSVRLAANQAKSQAANFVLPETNMSAVIEVDIQNPSRHIAFRSQS